MLACLLSVWGMTTGSRGGGENYTEQFYWLIILFERTRDIFSTILTLALIFAFYYPPPPSLSISLRIQFHSLCEKLDNISLLKWTNIYFIVILWILMFYTHFEIPSPVVKNILFNVDCLFCIIIASIFFRQKCIIFESFFLVRSRSLWPLHMKSYWTVSNFQLSIK